MTAVYVFDHLYCLHRLGIWYVIDARDLQLLNFAMWLLNIHSFSEVAAE